MHIYIYTVFPVALVVKKLPANAGHLRDAGLIPWLRRSPGEGNGRLLQQENSMDREAWRATGKESDTIELTYLYSIYLYAL